MDGFVPVSRPHIWGDEKLNLCQAIDGGWISSRGPFLDEFEDRFAEKIGTRYAGKATMLASRGRAVSLSICSPRRRSSQSCQLAMNRAGT
jgi:dTDP-4-amino-4,6-dideoxygalactose transaminase